MTGVDVLVFVAVGTAGVALVRFLGCEGYGPGYLILSMAFHYDPDLVIDGTRITINRVDFVIHAHGVGGAYADDLRLGLVAGGTTLVNGKELRPGKDAGLVQAEPAHGLYRLVLELSAYNFGYFSVRCEAFASSADSQPLFPSSTMTPDDIEVRVGETTYFNFTLTPGGDGWVVAPE